MQNAPSWILIVSLVVLLLLIAFSSGTEVAMLSANRYKIRAAAKAGNRTAKVLDALLAKPESWLGANLVLLQLASVAGSAIATLLAQRTGYEHAIPVMMFALAVFMIVFCELAPKIYATLKPDPVALSSTYIYKSLAFVARPITWFTNKAAYGFLRLFGVKAVKDSGQAMSPDELRSVVAEAGPMIPTRHRQMLLSILDLEHVTVNDIMIPRQDIASINIEDDWEDVLDQLRQTPHTRLPLHEGELDNLIGIVHMKRAGARARHAHARAPHRDREVARALLRTRGHLPHGAAQRLPAQPTAHGIRRGRIWRHPGFRDTRGYP
jgi:Mg2+/Co2+ transporter CorB